MEPRLREVKPDPDELGAQQARAQLEAAQKAEKQALNDWRNFSMLASLTADGEPGELDRLRRDADQAAERRQAAEDDCRRLGLDPESPPAGIDQDGPTSLAA